MSGRDLRTFLTSHRGGTFNVSNKEESLSSAYLAGSHGNKRFKRVDYDQLLATASQQRAIGKEQLKRMKALSKRNKQSKECSLLKKHHEIWDNEHDRLLDARRRAVSELELWKTAALKDEDMKSFIVEMMDYESTLCQERDLFESNTVDPIWSLRTDLKVWVNDRTCPESEQSLPLFDDVLTEIKSVKQQQCRIQQLLHDEYNMIWLELNKFTSTLPGDNNEPVITRGVPSVLKDMECPDEKLKVSCLDEFDKLDSHYQSLLEEKQSHVISCTHDNWCESDAERFSAILEQYPASLTNRRTLYINRLIREFPQKTRAEIVSHETWFNTRTHHLTQIQTIINTWERRQAELCEYVMAVFQKSKQSFEDLQQVRLRREEQTRLCKQLSEKVSKWHEEKMELDRLAAEAEKRQQAEDKQLRLVEEDRKRKHHEHIHQRIKAFHLKVKQQEVQQRIMAHEREAAAESAKKERLRLGEQRVLYRHELLGAKQEERLRHNEEARLEEIEKEKRLELLRQQVQVNVSTDPLRVLRETKSTKARSTANNDLSPELHIRQPLFQVNSFTAAKVTSDLRVRMETALREAGLHTTSYARKILATVPPPQRPRPDQISSLFKH